ncbi:hypothetical protein C3F00_018685 [Pseudomonas sp. MWU13-2860]|nr:hypothetical protein C3F00_018685 [Pseudomonas sp. MWU13-2860]
MGQLDPAPRIRLLQQRLPEGLQGEGHGHRTLGPHSPRGQHMAKQLMQAEQTLGLQEQTGLSGQRLPGYLLQQTEHLCQIRRLEPQGKLGGRRQGRPDA